MLDIITIGTATRDVFLRSPFFKVVKDPEHLKGLGFEEGKAECFAFGGKVEVGDPIFTIGGGAANAAVTFARQGFRTGTVISIGEDMPGEEIVNILAKEKISPFPIVHKKKSTGYSTILLSAQGERTILVARGAASELTPRTIPFSRLKASWAYFSPGAIPISLMQRVVHHFHKQGTNIAINPSGFYVGLGARRLSGILKKAAIVSLNRAEAASLTGVPFENERAILAALKELTPGIAVVTDGSRGVLVSDGKFIYRAGIFKEKMLVDRTGAGDAFTSGFVASLMQEKEGVYSRKALEKAVTLGSANATSVVEHIGAIEGILSAAEYKRNRRFSRLPLRATIL